MTRREFVAAVGAVGLVSSRASASKPFPVHYARPNPYDAVLRYVVHKGSITVDGISLTVSGLGDRSFTVSLIPETLERTNLGEAEAGTVVNLEVDVLAKYVERLMRR